MSTVRKNRPNVTDAIYDALTGSPFAAFKKPPE